MNKPILCLDFDGVVHRYSQGWQKGEIYDPPTDGFFEWLASIDPHFTVIVHSSRAKDLGATQAMSAWLRRHATEWVEASGKTLPLHVSFVVKKPAAFVTIDDRALTFTGNWADFEPQRLLAFKPWNQS